MSSSRPVDVTTTTAGHAPRSVVMIRPWHFAPNPATRVDNAYQSIPSAPAADVARAAYDEVTAMSEDLTAAGVTVHLYDDDGITTPDSVFPNNWFSTETSGTLTLFPMHSPNRRGERRPDIVDDLTRRYHVTSVRDYSHWETEGHYLEGTGSMVLDHRTRAAWACRSNRMSEPLFRHFCAEFGYTPFVVDALGPDGKGIYHTNVLMSVGTEVALVGLSALPDATQRRALFDSLHATGREVVELTEAQVASFAGNALELTAEGGNILVMSARGAASLDRAQRAAIERYTPIFEVHIPTIEHAGGSARCMLAGIHLTPRRPAGDENTPPAGPSTTSTPDDARREAGAPQHATPVGG